VLLGQLAAEGHAGGSGGSVIAQKLHQLLVPSYFPGPEEGVVSGLAGAQHILVAPLPNKAACLLAPSSSKRRIGRHLTSLGLCVCWCVSITQAHVAALQIVRVWGEGPTLHLNPFI
jgi:hypothetical protein